MKGSPGRVLLGRLSAALFRAGRCGEARNIPLSDRDRARASINLHNDGSGIGGNAVVGSAVHVSNHTKARRPGEGFNTHHNADFAVGGSAIDRSAVGVSLFTPHIQKPS
jgi:hypothetical protein